MPPVPPNTPNVNVRAYVTTQAHAGHHIYNYYLNLFLYQWAAARIRIDTVVLWESYGHEIGDVATGAGIADLFIVTHDRPNDTGINYLAAALRDREMDNLAITLLYAHRFYNTSNAAYQASLLQKFETIWNNYPHALCTPQTALTRGQKWHINSEFRKLLARVDMFLNKAGIHEYSGIRAATLSSRYLQCGALLSLKYLWDIVG